MRNSGQPTVQQGDTGAAVTRLQRALRRTPDLGTVLDGIFGPETRAAVVAFQEGAGLIPDGIVGPLTWAALPDGDPMPILREGSRGDVVSSLQTVLSNGADQWGEVTPGAIDGIFGPLTLASILAFQEWGGATVDGIVGDQTWSVPLHAASATLETAVGTPQEGFVEILNDQVFVWDPGEEPSVDGGKDPDGGEEPDGSEGAAMYVGLPAPNSDSALGSKLRVDSTFGDLSKPVSDASSPNKRAKDGRYVRADFEGNASDEPIRVDTSYLLAVHVAVESSSVALAEAPLLFEFPEEAREVQLTVQLNGDGIEIAEGPQLLYLPKSGPSRGKARFEVTPRREGACSLVITLYREGNFVQALTLTLQVGKEAAPIVTTSVGVPVGAAQQLRKRDATLVILRGEQGGYNCLLVGSGGTLGRLSISDDELADAIDQSRQAMLDVVKRRTITSALDLTDADRKWALQILASAGHRLFQRLFYHDGADVTSIRIGDLLLSLVNKAGEPLSIQIVSPDFPVPWAMLYVAETLDEANIEWQNFLGMRHIIEQKPLVNLGDLPDQVIRTDSPQLTVGLIFNSDIDKQFSAHYVEGQRNYWTTQSNVEPHAAVTYHSGRAGLLDALKSTATADQILYFYCHAATVGLGVGGGPDSSYLKLGGNEFVTVGDLHGTTLHPKPLVGRPLVFVNACESGKLSPLYYNGFLSYFMTRGARGLIGTECQTPARFAAEWARLFFDGFLGGEPIGSLFLRLRREVCEQHGNPLGLLYGVHCDGDIRVEPALLTQSETPPA